MGAAQASTEIKGAPQPIDAAALIDADRRRGRGALSKRSGRFEKETREEADDGWGIAGEPCGAQDQFPRREAAHDHHQE